jgi:hypothetical protein
MQYEERIVLFLDIIGWSEATNSNNISTRVEEVLNKLYNLYRIRTPEYKSYACKLAEEEGSTLNPSFLEVEIALCSDTLINSIPVHPRILQYSRNENIKTPLLLYVL